MRDILAGGEFTAAEPAPQRCRKPKARRLQVRRRIRRFGRRARSTMHQVTFQPGQLASPLLRCGFPSLAMH